MSLNSNEMKNIKVYKGQSYNLDTRTVEYSLRDIIKYVIYWKYLIDNYSSEIRITGTSIGVMSYTQMSHVSREEADDKSPKGILKLQSYLFMKDNNFSEDQQVIVNSYLENYYSFMNFLEYKNPIYLSVALLCIDIKREAEPVEESSLLLQGIEELDYGAEGDEFRYEDDDDEFGGRGDDDDEFGGGGGSEDFFF